MSDVDEIFAIVDRVGAMTWSRLRTGSSCATIGHHPLGHEGGFAIERRADRVSAEASAQLDTLVPDWDGRTPDVEACVMAAHAIARRAERERAAGPSPAAPS